jgi:hypothetical protein
MIFLEHLKNLIWGERGDKVSHNLQKRETARDYYSDGLSSLETITKKKTFFPSLRKLFYLDLKALFLEENIG